MTDIRLPGDNQARQTALDISRSFIVQAPAGSGKTGLLTQRFLALLAVVRQPEEILAITFTRKARGEMLERILGALEQAGQRAEAQSQDAFSRQLLELAGRALARSEQQGWRLLEQPNRLRILTIDAFNAGLTRQLPVLSQYGAQPQVVDNADRLYRQAVRQVLLGEHLSASQQQQVHAVLAHSGFQQAMLEDTLIAMLDKRERWMDLLSIGSADQNDRLQLEAVLTFIVEEHLQGLLKLDTNLAAELTELGSYAAGQSHSLDSRWLSDKAVDLMAGQSSQPGSSVDDLPIWQALTELVLTSAASPKPRTSRGVQKRLGFPDNNQYKMRMQVLLEQLADNPALIAHLVGLRQLPNPCYPDDQWSILRPMLVTLQLCLAELLLVFRENGLVDHNEMAARALYALSSDDAGGPSELALQLDARITHILVDEFQDTSIGQLQLLQKLTAGWQPQGDNSLFLVGDPMQSIYGFRKAEVGIFLSVWENGLPDFPLERLQLQVNFRTQRALVEWCNTIFQEILPADNNLNAGAVRWSRSDAWHPVAAEQPVEIILQIEKDRLAEAEKVVELVQQALQRESEEIAVLVRRRKDVEAILPALQKAGVAFQAVDMASLEQTPEVRDLLALTQALVHPGDRLSWLSVLRAPWCGLELAELLQIAGLGEAQDLTTVDPGMLDGTAQQRLSRVLSVLQSAVANRHWLTLRQLVTQTWQQLGGPACYLSNTALENAERFLALLDGESVAGDLDDPLQLEEQLHRIFASAETNPDAARVQVMTIHKAKGLEFDEVILPGLGYPIRYSDNDQPLLISEFRPIGNSSGLLLGMRQAAGSSEPDPVYRFINLLHAQRRENEARRLLYVATTRAKQRLHLLSHLDGKGEQPSKNSPMSWLWPLIEDGAQILDTKDIAENAEPAVVPFYRLPADWQPPEPAEQIQFTRQAVLSITELAPETPKPELPQAAAIGRVVHRALEALVNYGENWWQTLDQEKWVNLQLRKEQLTPDLHAAAGKLIVQAVNNTLEDEHGRWLLQPHTESACEFAIGYFEHDRLTSAIIDRTFVDANNLRWIIDYKTGLHEGEDVDSYIDYQVRHYRPQMLRYRQLMSEIDERDVQLALYFPLLKRFELIDG